MTDFFDMQISDYDQVRDTTGFIPASILTDGADQHFAVLDREQRVRARCSIWWSDTARVDGARSGVIGHYAATDRSCGLELIDHVCRQLKTHGCGIAVGPMDGSTWRRYRFVTGRGAAKPFFLEPDNPDDWPEHFTASGFGPLAHYVSEFNPDIVKNQPELGSARRRMRDLGVRMEPLDLSRQDEELAGIYDVVCDSFRSSFLYTPTDYASFLDLYAPLLAKVDPRLILLAKHEGRVVGFVFAPPDLLQAEDRDDIDTIVVKTVAILPRTRYGGLGRLLIVEMLGNAIDMRFTKAINALIHCQNRSLQISRDCAGPMRRYALFGRGLSA